MYTVNFEIDTAMFNEQMTTVFSLEVELEFSENYFAILDFEITHTDGLRLAQTASDSLKRGFQKPLLNELHKNPDELIELVLEQIEDARDAYAIERYEDQMEYLAEAY